MLSELPNPIRKKRITLKNGRLLQVGALVYRPVPYSEGVDRNHDILLITSRGSGRWILPKGWPMPGYSLAQAALRESYEEAGIRGLIHEPSIGTYFYEKKDMALMENNLFQVVVFAVLYQSQKKKWPERGQRIFDWVSPQEASHRVEENGLKKIIQNFTPPKP